MSTDAQIDEIKEKTLHAIFTLPFVEIDPIGGICMWPEEIDHKKDQAKDIAIGIRRAELTISLANIHRNELIIAWVLADMVRAGRMDDIAAGFLVRIAESAKAGGNH